MKNALLLMMFLIIISPLLFTQKNDGTPHYGGDKTKLFNPKTIKVFAASVTSISAIIEAEKPHYGIHLNVKNDLEMLSVHLRTLRCLNERNITFEVGDNLVIRGSRIVHEGIPAIIAMKIQKKRNYGDTKG